MTFCEGGILPRMIPFIWIEWLYVKVCEQIPTPLIHPSPLLSISPFSAPSPFSPSLSHLFHSSLFFSFPLLLPSFPSHSALLHLFPLFFIPLPQSSAPSLSPLNTYGRHDPVVVVCSFRSPSPRWIQARLGSSRPPCL